MASGTTAALVHLGEGLATARRPRAAALALEAAAAGDGEPQVRAAARIRAAELLLVALDAEAAAAASAAAAAASLPPPPLPPVSEGQSSGVAGVQTTGSPGWQAAASSTVPQTLSRVRHNTEQALLLLRGVAGALGPTLAALSLTDEVYTRSGDARGVLRILGRAHAALRDAGPVAPTPSASLSPSPQRTGGGAGLVDVGQGDGGGDVDRWGWWLFLRGRAVSVQSRSAPGAAAAAAAEAAAECRRRGDERAAAGFTLALVQLRLAAPTAVDAVAVAADLAMVEATLGLPAWDAAASALPARTPGPADRPPPHKRPRLPVVVAGADVDAALMRVALLSLRAVADLRRGDFPAVVAAAGALSAAFNACSTSQRASAAVAGAAVGVGHPPSRPRWVWFHRRALRALLLHCSATALAAADPRGAVGRAADALAALGVSMPALLSNDPGRLRTTLAATSLSNLDADCRHALAAAAAEGVARAELTRCSLTAAAPYVRAVATLALGISDSRAVIACSAAARLLTGQYRVLLGDRTAASTALEELEGVALEPPAAGLPVGTRHMAAMHCSMLTGRAITEFLPDGGGEGLASLSAPRATENGQVDAAVLFAQSLVAAQKDQVREATGLMDAALCRAGVERCIPDVGTVGGGGSGGSGGGAGGGRGSGVGAGGVNRALIATILGVRVGLVAVSGEAADGAVPTGEGGAEERRRAAQRWASDAGDLTTLIRVAKAAKRSSRRHLDVDGARMAKDSVASFTAQLSERQRLAPRW
ncbi:hypothetical protein MMPV_002353 [Pyropia vietnamensis]